MDGKAKLMMEVILVDMDACFRMEEEDNSALKRKSKKPMFFIGDTLLIVIGPKLNPNGTNMAEMNGRATFVLKPPFSAICIEKLLIDVTETFVVKSKSIATVRQIFDFEIPCDLEGRRRCSYEGRPR